MTTITVPDAARRLDIALPTAWRLAHAGRFPVPLEGSWPRWHVQAADVEAVLAGRSNRPESAQLEAVLERLRAGRPALRPALTLIRGGAE